MPCLTGTRGQTPTVGKEGEGWRGRGKKRSTEKRPTAPSEAADLPAPPRTLLSPVWRPSARLPLLPPREGVPTAQARHCPWQHAGPCLPAPGPASGHGHRGPQLCLLLLTQATRTTSQLCPPSSMRRPSPPLSP